MAALESLLQPFKLRHLTLRNRVMSTGHAPGYAEDGMPGERYQLYHEEKAKGGLALTIFGGSSSVAVDSPLPFSQVDLSSDRVLPYLHDFSSRIHRHGAAVFCQMTHMGRRAVWHSHHWLPLVSPSATRETVHRSYAKEMEDFDFKRVIRAFAEAAARCKEGGLDGVEVMAAAHHLIDSFLSPVTNKRTDRYGGSLENRARFGIEVLEAVREKVGRDFIVGIRMAGDEMLEGGLDAAECLKTITHFANSGLIDYVSVYQAHGDNFSGLAALMPDMSFPSAPFLHLASAVKSETDIAVFHASGIRDLATADRAVSEGHVDLVAMTRAHIADPHLVRKLQEGRLEDIRQCVGANYCVDHAGDGGGALCIQNASTGREKTLPHRVARSDRKRKVVVIGGGPGGLEAARVAAERGHTVVLMEKSDRLGGQINVAKAVPWRENLSGIVRWLEHQVRRKGVDLRLGIEGTPEGILAEGPDLVVLATGGSPAQPTFAGSELSTGSWSVLARPEISEGGRVLIYDEMGLHAGAGCAEILADRGASVELASADRMLVQETGHTVQSAYLRKLYQKGVILTPDVKLVGAYREGNGLVAVLRNEYTAQEEEREVDLIVHEYGTLPNDDLYRALRPQSLNLGEMDYDALIDNRPQDLVTNPQGRFQLFRIGDAVASRNIHAAIYDAARLLKDL